MSNGARSILVFGIYLLLLGAMLILAPNLLLGLFFLPRTTEVWIRLVGVLVLYLGFFHVQAARHELVPFFGWSTYVRPTLIVFFAIFVSLGFAKPPLILFGVVDLLGAIWTAVAMRSSKMVSANQ